MQVTHEKTGHKFNINLSTTYTAGITTSGLITVNNIPVQGSLNLLYKNGKWERNYDYSNLIMRRDYKEATPNITKKVHEYMLQVWSDFEASAWYLPALREALDHEMAQRVTEQTKAVLDAKKILEEAEEKFKTVKQDQENASKVKHPQDYYTPERVMLTLAYRGSDESAANLAATYNKASLMETT